MSDRESSWALAPPRTLHVVEKEEAAEWDGVEEQPTFQPELISAPELRAKARSSGYGKTTATINKVILEDDEIRPWQEEPTFRPALPEDPKRASARSSGYGREPVVVVRKEPESPKFQPTFQRAASAQKVYSAAKSSGYGKRIAEMPRPKSAPAPTFRPRLSSNSGLRSSVKSSQYGKKVPPPKDRPAREEPKPEYVSAYTLLRDKGEPPQAPQEDDRAKGWVLDCVRSSAAKPKLVGAFPSPGKVKLTQKQREFIDKAPSSAYGVASPPVSAKPQRPATAPSLRFDRQRSVLAEPLAPFALKTPLADKVRSSSYGVESPPVAPKPEPKAPEPKWNVALKGSINPELGEAPRSPLNDKVRSHQYGKADPPRGPRYESIPQPLWVPSNNPKVNLSKPPPVPRSKLTDQVQGHYGAQYDPSALYAFNGEDEFDEVEHVTSTIKRAVQVTNGNYQDEEEEYAEETVEYAEETNGHAEEDFESY